MNIEAKLKFYTDPVRLSDVLHILINNKQIYKAPCMPSEGCSRAVCLKAFASGPIVLALRFSP